MDCRDVKGVDPVAGTDSCVLCQVSLCIYTHVRHAAAQSWERSSTSPFEDSCCTGLYLSTSSVYALHEICAVGLGHWDTELRKVTAADLHCADLMHVSLYDLHLRDFQIEMIT